MYKIYWLINQRKTKTYIGFSNELQGRLREHKDKKVNSTKNFGIFSAYIVEEVDSLNEARKREKYWKSSAGRKKLKIYFQKIKNMPLSSNG